MTHKLSRKDFIRIAASGVAGGSIISKVRAADPMPSLASDLFFAMRIPNGYTWTLASRLGDMLYLAEDLLGPRDLTYTILGIEIGPDNPRLWYPGNRHSVIVQLAPSAATDAAMACYQLAHETVHLLAPNGGGSATNLEEAVACYFAAYFMKSRFAQPAWHPDIPSYSRALSVISQRMDADVRCIKRLRSRHLSFSDIKKEQLLSEFPDLGSGDLDFLLAKFDREGTSNDTLSPAR